MSISKYARQAIDVNKKPGLRTRANNAVQANSHLDYAQALKQQIFQDEKNNIQPASRMAGTALDDLGIDISPDSKRTQSDEFDRHKLGDKDYRSVAAEHKLRIANDMAGGGRSREELVDMLNAPGVQQHESFRQALSNDPALAQLNDFDAQGGFIRPEIESPSFVGEGQFGRVNELAPGYVSKKQAPLVEFNGYQRSEDGSQLPYGNLLPDGSSNFFRIQDYRDVQNEVDQLNYLNKRGKGITPKVENLIIEDDGATEVIMKDLRENYSGGDTFLEKQAAIFNDDSASQKQKAQAFKNHELFRVKSKQQEARAALLGVELQDRHLGNVMANKMNNRPLQIDPSGRSVEGFDRDFAIINNVTDGFSAAGLTEEADIFYGLAKEANERGDSIGFHDLAQQGMSRLMKIKDVI